MDLLIVDDEPNIRKMLRALLESEGYSVREADSAEAALVEVAEVPPEAVLLDMALPGMSGLEALPLMAQAAPGLPVVMMSGRATLSDAVRATREGAFHFIEKPLTPEAVLLTLRGAVEVGRARDLNPRPARGAGTRVGARRPHPRHGTREGADPPGGSHRCPRPHLGRERDR